jgi:hypothetical protein
MIRKKIIGMCTAAALVGLGLVAVAPGVASADNLGGVIIADMNNDGIPDQVQLGEVGGPATTTCTVTVSYGLPGGSFGAPHVHTYTTIDASKLCPDRAIALKLGNEQRPDLITWVTFGLNSLVVLHKFQPTQSYGGVIQPSYVRTADLNGDGRLDLIEWSEQVNQLLTFINTPQATLAPGPISFQSLTSGGAANPSDGPQYVLADFNGDGGQDMVASVNQQLSEFTPISAEVFFSNGQAPVVLASTTDFLATWSVFTIDLDHNGINDVGIIEKSSSGVTTVQYFRNDGAGHFTPA